MAGTNLLRQLFETTNRLQSYTKGSTIIHQGGNLEYVYLIDGGLVKVSDADSYGAHRTVAIFSKNHLFPISWLLSQAPESGARYNYQAITDVSCYIVPREKVRELLASNPGICCTLLDIVTKSYINATARIHNLQKTNVRERVDFVLYYLAALIGKVDEHNIAEIDAPLTHQEIADLAGLSRETVSHQFSKKKYREIFWKTDHKTHVNLNMLDIKSMPAVYSLNVIKTN